MINRKNLETKKNILDKLKLENREWAKWREDNKNEEITICNIKFENQNFQSFQFQNIIFENVKFIDCKINSCVFSKVKLEKVLFKNSDLDKTTFNEINAFELNLNNSIGSSFNLTNSKIDSSKLFDNQIKHKNFAGSEFINIDLSNPKSTDISFSRIKIDSKSLQLAKKNRNITIGLNGIYNRLNNSASLRTEKPKGDEMLGGNEDVILSSLNKSKRAFTTSVSATIIAFTLKFIGVNSFAYVGLQFNPDAFLILAIPVIFFSLYKSNVLLKDVVANAKYIQSQIGAVKVGRFPWLVSRFWGISKAQKIESYLVRILYCLHPLLLIPIMKSYLSLDMVNNTICDLSISENLSNWYLKNSFYFLIPLWSLYISAIYLSIKLFLSSQKMQKPLLFDLQNPAPNTDEMHKIANSIEEIKSVISGFFGNNNFSTFDWYDLKTYLKNKKEISEIELRELKNKR